MKESILYERLKDNKVRCKTCAHQCVVDLGKRGVCGVRENRDGRLYVLNYAKLIARSVDPIEKKPLFHFMPGAFTYSIASLGCNFKCLNCQNWEISQGPRLFPQREILGEEFEPQDLLKEILDSKVSIVAYTYTEPTIFLEYALDVMKIAKSEGLKNVWVTNGYMTKETLDLIAPYLDAVNVDLKSFSDEFYISNCSARLQPVLDSLKRIKEKGIWLEVTTLVIPSLNDSPEMFEEIAEFIAKELGTETPWHISRFSPEISWKLQDLKETPVETLKQAYEIGKRKGLKYVYVGNALNPDMESTYCPKCGALCIKRIGYSISRFDENGKCPKCKESLDIVE